MGIPMVIGLGMGVSSNSPAIPMGIPMANGIGRVFCFEVTSYSYGYVYGFILMGIPVASGSGMGFSSKLPAIPMGIPMEVFPWIFLWLVA